MIETSNTAQTATDIYTMLAAGGFKVLVACEKSQTVCKAFRALGIEAYSCDLQEPSGGKPEWHIVGDAVKEAYSGKYDMMIAHPPCTYMSKAGARWMYPTAGNLDIKRFEKAMEAKDMFLKLLNAPIKYIAVENPVPLKVVELPKHSQAIQPYEYGHEYSKKTLLWLKNLPILKPTDIQENYKPYLPSNTGGAKRGQKYSRGTSKNAEESSKTFEGIARAMAEQWLLACCQRYGNMKSADNEELNCYILNNSNMKHLLTILHKVRHFLYCLLGFRAFERRQLAKKILIALLQNPERYKYITEQVESGKLKQEEANNKNIHKAYKIADSFVRWQHEA